MKKSKKIDSIESSPERMLRKHKQVLRFNDKEFNVISFFFQKYKIESKARFYREAIISSILQQLERDHPKLF